MPTGIYKRKGRKLKNFPHIYNQFDEEKNTISKREAGELSAHTAKPLHWVCRNPSGCEQKCVHRWTSGIKARIKAKLTCPFNGCDNDKSDKDKNLKCCPCNSFFMKYPALGAQFHPTQNSVDPLTIPPGSGRKIWWRCEKFNCDTKCPHDFEAKVQKN